MDREISTKAVGPVAFTDDDKGEVQAVVYTLGVVDRDGDVILPESFQGEAKVKLSHYGHSAVLAHAKGTGNPVEAPVGKGVVRRNAANELEFRGNYFMSTTRGRDAYFTAKEMGAEQEWSVSFWRDKGEKPDAQWSAKGARRLWRTEIDPFEVSPVTIAGGRGTRTVGVKEAEEAAAQSAEDAAESAEAAEQAKQAAEEAAAAAETAKAETEAEQKRQADEAEALATKQREEAEAKQQADEIALKAQTSEAMEEYHRVQRTLKRLGVTP